MKKMLKLVWWSVVVALVLLLGAMLWVDRLAKAGVEYGATYALGVKTTLDSADVGIVRGSVAMDGLQVSNPQGFTQPDFLKLGHGGVEVSLASLRSDVVEVRKLELSGIVLNLEKNRDGQANYDAILANLKRFESTEPKPQEPAKEGKKFIVRDLVIRDVTANVNVVGLVGNVQVKIPEIELKDVGSDNQGAAMGQVVAVVTKAIMLAVVEKGGGIIPADVLNGLGQGLGGLKSLASEGVAVVGDLGGKLGDVGKQAAEEAGKVVDEAAKGAGKAVEDVTKGIGDLFKKK